jgi:hypothetical protein
MQRDPRVLHRHGRSLLDVHRLLGDAPLDALLGADMCKLGRHGLHWGSYAAVQPLPQMEHAQTASLRGGAGRGKRATTELSQLTPIVLQPLAWPPAGPVFTRQPGHAWPLR